MKYLSFFTLLLLFTILTCSAQETVKRKKYHSLNFIEKYEVLKDNKKIKQGKAYFYRDTVLLASGAYENNKRSGRWIFFSENKKLEQIYDYTTKTLKVNKPGPMVTYDISANPGDTVQKPALIGGIGSAIPFFMEHFFNVYHPSQQNINCDLYFLFSIDENGTLLKWDYQLKSTSYNDSGNLNFSKLPEEVLVFSPAVVNGKPIASTIVYKTRFYTKTSQVITSMQRY